MNYVLSMILLFTSLLFVIIIFNCYRYKNIRGAKTFGFLVSALLIHSLGYAMELISTDLNSMYFWIRIEYIGLSFLPFLIIWFTVEYTDIKRRYTTSFLVFFLLQGLLTLLLVNTNPWHHLYYSVVDINHSYDFPVLELEPGIFYNIQAIILTFSLVLSIGLLTYRYRELRGSYRKRVLIVIIGILFPFITALYYVFGLGPEDIDISSFSFFFFCITIMFGLFRYNAVFFSQVTHEMIFNTIEEAVLVIDNENHVIRINSIASEYFEELRIISIGDNINQYPLLMDIHNGDEVQLIEKENRFFQVRNIHMSGSFGRIFVFTDITENQITKIKLQEMAITDPLTKLYNRRHFIDAFEAQDKPGSLLLIDLDNFKKINDTYGHNEGDRVLLEVSDLLRQVLPQDLYCRYGGEEFAVLLVDNSIEDARAKAEQLRYAIEAKSGPFQYTASIGVAAYTPGAFSQSVKLVDDALYEAKELGRNRVVCG